MTIPSCVSVASAIPWKRRLKRWLARYPLLWRWARFVYRHLPRSQPRSAAEHWDLRVAGVEAGELGGWLDCRLIEREHIRPRISGDPEVDYLEHFVRTHLPAAPVACGLSLGCGGGGLERVLIRLGAARRIEGLDSSLGSIRLARRLAAADGLGKQLVYEVSDLERCALPTGTYDFVIAKMALHHLERLEHVYEQVARSLKPGGKFVLNEFVGPTRFQWTDLQLEIMNRLLSPLPPVRREVPFIERPTPEEVRRSDPSEAVRSAEILPLLEERFEILEQRPYGGTLLHILLSHVLPTLDQEAEMDRTYLRLFSLAECLLVDGGVLPSDFVYVVARPR